MTTTNPYCEALGIEVRRAEESITLTSRTIPAGAYIVSNAQPSARLVRNLLDPKTEQPQEFIKRQEERRARRQPDQIYDITAWNLPMLYDVELVTSPAAITVRSTPVPMTYDAAPPARSFAPSKVAYLMPWGSGAAALAAEALRQNIRMHSVGGAFTLNEGETRVEVRGAAMAGEAPRVDWWPKGDEVFGIETEDGYRVAPYDPEFERKMEAARKIMKKRRNVLRELAND